MVPRIFPLALSLKYLYHRCRYFYSTSMKREKERIALKKAGTLIQKILQMIEEDRYCIDIIQQNLAVIGLLKSVNEKMLEGHLHHCFRSAMESTDEEKKEDMIEELVKVMRTAQKK